MDGTRVEDTFFMDQRELCRTLLLGSSFQSVTKVTTSCSLMLFFCVRLG